MRFKGVEPMAVEYGVQWLESLGYRQMVIHTDGEPAIIDYARDLIAKFGSKLSQEDKEKIVLKKRESPVGSSASLGGGERAVQT